jgi:hypothetical protein
MHQVTITVPSDFTPPKFIIGQLVEVVDKHNYDDIRGRVVGMTYTSRDAALAEHSFPGWYYVVETPAFEHSSPHHSFNEENLQPLMEQQEAA